MGMLSGTGEEPSRQRDGPVQSPLHAEAPGCRALGRGRGCCKSQGKGTVRRLRGQPQGSEVACFRWWQVLDAL